MASTKEIENLPDFPAIQQIQSALWGTSKTRGAAVMVGAGFSSNAILPSPNSAKPPLWTDFHKAMATRIYPNGNAPSDPLRLAEEYQSELGSAALEGLICDLVRDMEWEPGPLHTKLVNLPWRDILTTNWDTLLERAETNNEQTYEFVRTISDISRTRSPRIIKLHGSMPSNRPFILTEEDYRTYPKRFAPLVNLAQQVLLENELCLIGFSGDDPNFLQWSGWVRDELGIAARRIYLVGVLHLSHSKRKLLEARNVSPIDLGPLVEQFGDGEKHTAASRLFLEYLEKSKPKPAAEWPSQKSWPVTQRLAVSLGDKVKADSLVPMLKALISIWREERESYPGWLVCPAGQRKLIRSYAGTLEHALRRGLELISLGEQAEAVYEAMWRFDLSFFPTSQWLRDLAGKTTQDAGSALTRRQRCELGGILLRMAREEGNRALFDQWSTFLQKHAETDDEVLALLAYESSLWARDHLHLHSLSKLVGKIKAPDPIWKTRRAALLYELGDSETAANLAQEAVEEAQRRYRRDPRSIWSISRLGWALLLARASRRGSPKLQSPEPLIDSTEWPDYFRKNKCAPWDELDALDRDIGEAFRKAADRGQDIHPNFDPGSYSTTVHFSDSLPFAQYESVRLADIVGLPAQVSTPDGISVDLMRSRLERALSLSDRFDADEMLRSLRIPGASSDRLIEKSFDLISVAQMPFATVEMLIGTLWDAIEFGLSQFASASGAGRVASESFWRDRLPALVEVLSRLIVRLSGEKALAAFRRSAALVKDLEWKKWPLFDALGNLLRRSLSAVSPADRKDLLLEIINLPLPDEKGISGDRLPSRWPELMVDLAPIYGRSSDNAAFTARVKTLISKVGSGDSLTRQRAMMRVAYLRELDMLSEDEAAAFGKALWARRDPDSGLPFDGYLCANVIFGLPGIDKQELKSLFNNYFLKPFSTGLTNAESLIAIGLATAVNKRTTRNLDLTIDEALSLFDAILSWRPHPAHFDLDSTTSNIKRLIGNVLTDAALPFLNAKSIGRERIDNFFNCIETGAHFASLVTALPYIVQLDPPREGKAIELIRRALVSGNDTTATWGFSAIHRWCASGKVPGILKQAVIRAVVASKDASLSSALAVATKLLDSGHLNEEDKNELVHGLEIIGRETAYATWDKRDARTVTISWIRERCVQLADKLQRAGASSHIITAWIDGTRNDPLPEVRYALDGSS